MDDDRYTRITLRIPKDLHQALQAEADATSKSLNAEIVNRLASSFDFGGDGVLAHLRRLDKQVAQLLKLAEEGTAERQGAKAKARSR